MSKNYSLESDGSFVIKDYNHAQPFSNFLPGIAGVWGVPLWVFYVNRGQGVVSFGIKDKDHAISEFFPANKAYSFAASLGFRTFLKINKNNFIEPFKLAPFSKSQESMTIRSDSLEIEEVLSQYGLKIKVKYYTLANAPVAGLVRKVTIENITKSSLGLEVVDGLSKIVPFGAANYFLKDMSRTLEAWMRAEVKNGLALFRLKVDPRDVSQTKYIKGANFNYSFYEDNGKKKPAYMIVDPRAVFAQDTSFSTPVNFLKESFKVPLDQINCGQTPSALSYFKYKLAKGQSCKFYSIFGAAFKSELIESFTKGVDGDFLRKKELENQEIVESMKDNCLCVSGSKNFSQYVKSTYLDNVLRGGYPYRVNNSTKTDNNGKGIYYIYSRKHGDLERDYNQFQLLPSYFSEGQANYRDINQNRRMDLFFEPELGSKNIIYFLNFLKIDGYNPLVIRGEKLCFAKIKASSILEEFGIKDQKLLHLMVKGFYLGDFFKLLDEEKIKSKRREELVACLLKKGKREPKAIHSEGYWIDHWHYNLDLIESFLYFYPDKLEELFLREKFLFWDDEYSVKPRKSRYSLRSGKVYQADSLAVDREKRTDLKKRDRPKMFLRTKKGQIYDTNLICKLLTLVLNKAATLDPAGIGIEMEADKPGWCDSLNGLPALFGSSLCETLALKRALLMLGNVLDKLCGKVGDIAVPVEVNSFFQGLNSLLSKSSQTESNNKDYLWWDKSNFLKENFREKTCGCLSGVEKKLSLIELNEFLKKLVIKLNKGISKAKDKKTGLPLSYFTYSVKKYDTKNGNIIPRVFAKKNLPLYLEGVVHALRVESNKNFHQKLKKSDLFDKKLKMYKLNASLKEESLEIGRSRVFTPGWLENESIWLHMEYKYFLELLKNGFYEEFYDSFYKGGVCFFDPKDYGRNPLENSSFIVSSVYPDKSLWGKGFVARLSGATAELINIWIVLCLGKEPFYLNKSNQLCLRFSPILKKELFTTTKEIIDFKGKKVTLPSNTFTFKLFSKTLVCHHNPKRKDTFAKDCKIEKIKVTSNTGKVSCFSSIIKPSVNLDLRKQKVERIDVYWR
ncbi:MAG: hypothetical protein KAS05_00500 [Candidatus Omnitrophica bacterium]|nr:hypothetical protein [Candidatus Omnitrophota bacterium]